MSGTDLQTLAFDALLGPQGWLYPGYLQIDGGGRIHSLGDTAPADAPVLRHTGLAIPGMPNLHSHAFQRAIAGRSEFANSSDDSFWTWREAMYRCALALDPEQFEAIAAQAYVEMLEAGMTAVGEFHYLHHDPQGERYAEPAELGLRIHAAASSAGIGLTLLPVLYAHAGFGEAPEPSQRRFVHPDVEEFLRLVQRLRQEQGGLLRQVGLAPHSLRAVAPEELDAACAGLQAMDPRAPLHIHIAEQQAEVDACLAAYGARPLQWLSARQELDRRWCLVHATHLDTQEAGLLASSGACLGLCTTTEANLGDGHFALPAHLEAGGRFGIGSDSQIEIDPCAELRWAEYQHRLLRQRRNVLAGAGGGGPHLGRLLWERAAAGGAQALAQSSGSLAVGQQADLVVLDPDHPRLLGLRGDLALDALVFSAGSGAVREVMVGGAWVVQDGRHIRRDEIRTRFGRAMQSLYAQIR